MREIMLVLVCGLMSACGGSTDVAITNSNQQEQNQTGEGDLVTAQEACLACVQERAPEQSLADCVMSFGFDTSDC